MDLDLKICWILDWRLSNPQIQFSKICGFGFEMPDLDFLKGRIWIGFGLFKQPDLDLKISPDLDLTRGEGGHIHKMC